MRVVLDTNLVVSALLWGGTPYRLIEAAVAGEIELFTSPALLSELVDVLGREHIASKLEEQQTSVEAVAILYGRLAKLIFPQSALPVILDDPDDDELIAAALAASADLLISGDHSVLAIREHQGIRIVTAVQALAIIEQAR